MNRILIAILLSFCILTGNSQNNRDGNWDGFQRINTETKSGGIVGIFKQFSPVDEQWITLNFLDEKKEYIVK
ncbi:MAG: hypothetical protein K0B11_21835, partial [Mariniphaga sp.]|nr:hypothetical protein [Mariniphaga sp.]